MTDFEIALLGISCALLGMLVGHAWGVDSYKPVRDSNGRFIKRTDASH